MKYMVHYISLGTHCVVAEGIKMAEKRYKSYPFDWVWCPSKTTFHILELLINKSSNDACEYMTTGYKYYKYEKQEYFTLSESKTKDQMNPETGLGIPHDTINDEYKIKLTRRLERLLQLIKSGDKIVFIYADAPSESCNYHLDGILYGLDATEYLNKMYDLIKPLNPNIEIVYFAWKNRMKESSTIKYIEHANHNVTKQITYYIRSMEDI